MALTDDLYYSLRVAYRAKLHNQVVVNGFPFPAYTAIRQISSTASKYLLINAYSSASNNTKVSTQTSSLVQISIFCKGPDLDGNEHEDAGAQVLALIEPYTGYKLPINENFQNIEQRVLTDMVMPVRMTDTVDPVYERQIIVQHRISHLKRSLI